MKTLSDRSIAVLPFVNMSKDAEYHSGLIPKIIGVLLMLGCFSFLVDFFLFFLLPNYSGTTTSAVTSQRS
ncbi:MAG: hypothetical protein KTR30_34425 [Saprospiraceae bacterium]|nr:hypothetical protein [Saprospiraceae bacterium]